MSKYLKPHFNSCSFVVNSLKNRDILNFSPAAADARILWRKYLESPIPYSRDEAFTDLMKDVKQGLRRLCCADSDVLFMTASGTGALECAIAALPVKSKILVVRNGYFSDRLFKIAKFHFHEVFIFDIPFGEALNEEHETDLLDLSEQIEADVIICVHLETSSALVNDITIAGRIGCELGVLTIVDGMSSLGAVECRLDKWGIDCFISSAYKCLMCPPGLSFIIANEKYFDIAKRRWSFSFDNDKLLLKSRRDDYLWSPSVLSLLCLKDIINNIIAAGKHYYSSLSDKAELFRDKLSQAGMDFVGNIDYFSPCFTAIKLEEPAADIILPQLKEKHGIIIGKGMGEHADNILRIGHYPFRTMEELDILAEALIDIMKDE
ncbi:MAG: alanine--glyoxylate aminotransferase family protein [FCB group bacterium]|nr:alanine--glyoxylate aminotransferase family protein [FCB group bacterium]